MGKEPSLDQASPVLVYTLNLKYPRDSREYVDYGMILVRMYCPGGEPPPSSGRAWAGRG